MIEVEAVCMNSKCRKTTFRYLVEDLSKHAICPSCYEPTKEGKVIEDYSKRELEEKDG